MVSLPLKKSILDTKKMNFGQKKQNFGKKFCKNTLKKKNCINFGMILPKNPKFNA